MDVDGTILMGNKGVEIIKGYKLDEMIGHNFNIFYRPSDRQANLPQRLINLATK